MTRKSLNFIACLLILLLCVINLEYAVGLKCKFNHYDGYYLCDVIPDSSRIKGKHVGRFIDDDVRLIRYNGTIEESTPFCQRFRNLSKIHVFEKRAVGAKLFEQCENLQEIEISFTDIEEIPENLFAEVTQLIYILLSNNKLRTLPEDIFSNQEELVHLYLENNQISTLPSNVFKSLTKLKSLNLGRNQINSLNLKWFESLQSLQKLWFYHNNIHDLPRNVFEHLENLEWLDLDNNQLTTIHSDSFGIYRNQLDIDFGKNKIRAIDEKFIENTSIIKIDMKGNICSNEYIYKRNKLKEKLSNCTMNYQPRDD